MACAMLRVVSLGSVHISASHLMPAPPGEERTALTDLPFEIQAACWYLLNPLERGAAACVCRAWCAPGYYANPLPLTRPGAACSPNPSSGEVASFLTRCWTWAGGG